MLSIILYQNSTVNVFLYGIADPKATTEICLAPVTIYKLMNIHPEMTLELSTRGRAVVVVVVVVVGKFLHCLENFT